MPSTAGFIGGSIDKPIASIVRLFDLEPASPRYQLADIWPDGPPSRHRTLYRRLSASTLSPIKSPSGTPATSTSTAVPKGRPLEPDFDPHHDGLTYHGHKGRDLQHHLLCTSQHSLISSSCEPLSAQTSSIFDCGEANIYRENNFRPRQDEFKISNVHLDS